MFLWFFNIYGKSSVIFSLVKIWKISYARPGCTVIWILWVVYFPVKHCCPYNKDKHNWKHRQTDTNTDSNTQTQDREKDIDRPTDRQTDRWPNSQTVKQTKNQTQSKLQTDKQTHTEIDKYSIKSKQTDIQLYSDWVCTAVMSKWRHERSSRLIRNLSNCEREAWKNFRLQRDSNPWPLRYRCSALPTELWSHNCWEQVNFSGSIMPLRVIQHYSDWVCTAVMSKWKHRQTDTNTDSNTQTQDREKDIDRPTDRQTDRWPNSQTNKKPNTVKVTDRQTDTHRDRQI